MNSSQVEGSEQQRNSEGREQKANKIVNKSESRGENLANNIDEFEAEENLINHQLDHDCLAKIFSYLPALDRLDIKRVCKKWEEAVEMSWYNVKKIDAKNLPIFIIKKEATLRKLLTNCCQYLTHLKIDYCQYYWIPGVLKNNCKNIVYFDVDIRSKYSPSYIYEIIGSMTKLKCLKTRVDDNRKFPNLWNELSGVLPAETEEIHLFTISRHYGLNEFPEILPMLNKFRNLRRLTLQYFRITTAIIESILLNKNSLIYLNLTGCYLSDEFSIIFTQLVYLEHLNLRCVQNLEGNIITEIVYNCPKLKYLEISLYYGVHSTRRSILNKLKYLKNLQHLDVHFIHQSNDGDDNLIRDIFNNCKKLKYLDVGEGCNFSTLDIEAITKLNNLQYLNLCLAKVDSQSITNIASNCHELKELSIYLNKLSESDLEKLTNLKKLEKLYLDDCDNLTDNLLSKFVNNFKNLVDLDLRECQNITEATLLQVGKLQYLKRLDIGWIENIPNAMFYDFRKLEELSCNGCPSVADEGIIEVINNCFNLSCLQVFRTRITVDTLVHAAKRRVGYKILSIDVDELLYYTYYIALTDKHSPYLKIQKGY